MKRKYPTIYHFLKKCSNDSLITSLSLQYLNLICVSNYKTLEILNEELICLLTTLTQRKTWRNYKISKCKIKKYIKIYTIPLDLRISHIIREELFMRDVNEALYNIKNS